MRDQDNSPLKFYHLTADGYKFLLFSLEFHWMLKKEKELDIQRGIRANYEMPRSLIRSFPLSFDLNVEILWEIVFSRLQN